MQRILVLIWAMSLSVPVSATEKIFLAMTQTCYVAGGQILISKQTEFFYSEIIGSLRTTPSQICIKSFFDTRACQPAILYDFRMACRDGLATTPQLYMALFGNDKENRENGFTLNGNQLSYIDPVRDFSGSSGQRVYLPPGYAPFKTSDIDTGATRLAWDDGHQRPTLTRNPSDDQERRIRDLFVARAGYVEPFPESHIKRAAAISEEKPQPPPPPPSCTLSGVTLQSDQSATFYSAQSVPASASCTSIAQVRACMNGILSGNVTYQYASCLPMQPPSISWEGLRLALGYICVLLLYLLSTRIEEKLLGGLTWVKRILALSVAGFIYNSGLYLLGATDEIKLMTIPIGMMGLSVGLFLAVAHLKHSAQSQAN